LWPTFTSAIGASTAGTTVALAPGIESVAG